MTATVPPLSQTTFAEYEELMAILDAASPRMGIRVVGEVKARGRSFSVHVAALGSSDPLAPAIGFFAGIHWLERIGTQLLLDYMRVMPFRVKASSTHQGAPDGARFAPAYRSARFSRPRSVRRAALVAAGPEQATIDDKGC
jgi:hypothetical protein